jgi:cell division protein FtsB
MVSTVVTRGATSRPRTGWRSNEELEAQNRALREGLEAVSASRRELEERHNLLAKHLESASESFAESYRVMRDRQALLHAQVSSGKNIARTNEELEAQVAQLSFELSQVTLQVADREQHTVLRDAKVLEEKRLAQEAIKLVGGSSPPRRRAARCSKPCIVRRHPRRCAPRSSILFT